MTTMSPVHVSFMFAILLVCLLDLIWTVGDTGGWEQSKRCESSMNLAPRVAYNLTPDISAKGWTLEGTVDQGTSFSRESLSGGPFKGPEAGFDNHPLYPPFV